MNCEFRYVRGHVEVYSMDGKFLFSADTEAEAYAAAAEESVVAKSILFGTP